MTEIKRYSIPFDGHPDYPRMLFSMAFDDDGEWVRWEDVRGYIFAVEQMAKDLDLDALKGLLCARPKVEEAPSD